MGKIGSRLSYTILGIRWVALSIGFILFLSKAPSGTPALFESLFKDQAVLFLLILTGLEITLSLLQLKFAQQKTGMAFVMIFADLLIGIFLVYAAGASYFLLATILPILETFFLFDSGGILMAVFDLLLVAAILTENQTQGTALTFVISASVLCVPIMGLFLLLKKQENEAQREQREEQQDKKNIQDEISQANRRIENLHRDLVASQNELEDLKAKADTALAGKLEETKQQMMEVRRRETEAAARAQDLSEELNKLKEQKEKLHFLLETSGEFHTSLHLEEALVSVVKTIQKIVNFQTCVIFLVEEEQENKKLYAEAAAGAYADYFRNYTVGFGEGFIGWVGMEKQPAIIEHGSLITANGHEFSTLLTNEQSALAMPILYPDGNLFGVIYLGDQEARAYSWQEVNLLLAFLPHVQAAILKAAEFHKTIAQGVVDPITGLHNRVYFEERLGEEIRRAYRYQTSLSLIILKIDRVEKLKLELDEKALKQLILDVAELLKSYLRDIDVLASFEEDKFGIMLVQAERLNAVLIAERIRLAIEMRAFGKSPKKPVKLTVSVGVASYPKDALYKPDLLAKCNANLEIAVSKGGNQTNIAP